RRGLWGCRETILERLARPGTPLRPLSDDGRKRRRKAVRSGMDAQRWLIDLADLAVRTMHVDQFLRWHGHVQQGIAVSRHLAETHVDRQDHVGVAQQSLDMRGHPYAGLAAI